LESNSEFLGFRIFTIVEYIFIAYYLYINISSATYRRIIIWVSSLFLAFCLFDLFTSKSNTFDSLPAGIEGMLVIVFSLFYLFEKIKQPNSLFLYSTSGFWIIVALIIYFSGTFFLFIYSQSYFNDPDFQREYSLMIAIFNILRNIIFAIAILIKSDVKTPNPIVQNKKPFDFQP
jgi:hypothetical protein